MRKYLLLAIVLVMAGGSWRPPAAWAAAPAAAAASTNAVPPGVELARAISEITGVAISPLLGVSAVGAWKYFHARTPQQRARLPWFAQPWFWIPALVLVAACVFKDTVGAAAPRALKKPLDLADAIEHKISGLVAAGAFVPLVIAVFPSPPDEAFRLGATGFLAAIDLSWLGNGLLVPVAMLAFFFVFLASNAINILILLSPFAVVDAALKGFRLLVLATLPATAFITPWLGAGWALLIIVLAYLIAGWSFRLMVYGSVFSWEILSGKDGSADPAAGKIAVFTQRGLKGVPVRSFGRLETNGARWFFSWRPWLILPRRTLPLPAGEAAVLKGVISPLLVRQGALRAQTLARFPPRYRGREVELAKRLDVREVLDGRIVRGLKAAWKWLRETVFGGSANADAVGAVNAGT